MKKAAKTIALLIATGIFIGLATVSHGQTTIISDHFNRNGVIAGSAPDIADTDSAPGSTWTGGSLSCNTTAANSGGPIINEGNWGAVNTELNFTPTNGYIYTMSLTVNLAPIAQDTWAFFGFDNGTTAPNLPPFPNTPGPWVLVKPTGEAEGYYTGLTFPMFTLNAGTLNGAGTNNLMQIVLDTTGVNWKAQAVLNGVKEGSNVTLPNNWAINKVMIGCYPNATATFTSFSVTRAGSGTAVVPPKPAGGATLAIGTPELVPLHGMKYSDLDIDASCMTLKKNDSEIYIWSTCAVYAWTKWCGTLADPFRTAVWHSGYKYGLDGIRDRWDWNGHRGPYNPPFPYPWPNNLYKCNDGSLIGFVHVETAGATDAVNCKFRTGLAYSVDQGDHWKYLGDILRTQQDGFHNMGGLPYIVVGERLYVYFNDYPRSGGEVEAVARAKISDVLAAAKRGTVCTWKKYASGQWNEDGLTGAGSNIFPWDSHADAAYCRPYGKYLRTGWNGGTLYLLSSTDGINWGDQKVLYSALGEVPYSFFAGLDGGSDDCSEVGNAFSIYFPNRDTGQVYRIPVTVQGGPIQ
jgi:hypothetical protein